MKKLISIGMTLCALAAAVLFWLLAGTQFFQLLAGPVQLGDSEDFAMAEGKYLSYEAAYPVASRAEEYYSGDQSRVRLTGFVTYDAQRQAFLYLVVPEGDARHMSNLVWNLSLAAEMREDEEMLPTLVQGTLEPMEESAVRLALEALEKSDLASLYGSFVLGGGEGNPYEVAYCGDTYGQTVKEAMALALAPDWQQADWYCIRQDTVGGLPVRDIWLCVLAAAVSLVLFVARLILLLAGGKEKKAGAHVPDDKVEQLLAAQRGWIEAWCRGGMEKGIRYAYLTVLGCVAVLGGIGILVGSFEAALTFHLPLGVLLGEVIAVILWLSQRSQSNSDKLVARLRKGIAKELPSPGDREAFAEDILEAGRQWSFDERNQDSELHGTVGSRYWCAFTAAGVASIVDSARLKKMETAMVSGEIRVNRVRTRYLFFTVQFFYQNTDPKKTYDRAFSFQSNQVGGKAVEMMKERVGDAVEIKEGFSKDVRYSM